MTHQDLGLLSLSFSPGMTSRAEVLALIAGPRRPRTEELFLPINKQLYTIQLCNYNDLIIRLHLLCSTEPRNQAKPMRVTVTL